MEEMPIFDDVKETKLNTIIIRPKVKRLISYKRHNDTKTKTSSNKKEIYSYYWYWNNCEEKKSLNLDDISLEEIKEDFIKLNEHLEEEYFYNEIMGIMSISKKNSINQKKKKKQCKQKKEQKRKEVINLPKEINQI